MLNVVDLRGREPSISELRRVLPRAGVDVNAVLPTCLLYTSDAADE